MTSKKQYFDSDFEPKEQLPRKFSVKFESVESVGIYKTRVLINGVQIGDTIDDNSMEEDGYRFHDVFHYSYACYLSWSPCTRSMMNRKRKSNSVIDQTEDGARATITEEAISLMLFGKAKKKGLFKDENSVCPEVLSIVKEMTEPFEVRIRSKEDWESAILVGYKLFRALLENNGGEIQFDMDKKKVSFKAIV